MKTMKIFAGTVAGIALLAVLIFVLSAVFQLPEQSPGLETSATPVFSPEDAGGVETPGYIPPPTTSWSEVTSYPAPPSVTPPPPVTLPPSATSPWEPTPTVYLPFPEFPPLPPNVKAVTLHNGDIWLQQGEEAAAAITSFGDVFVIFGWNFDGSKLLFGKGRVVQSHLVGDTTELWMLDVNTGQTQQLTTSNAVKTASWSPVDDRLAYCELGFVLTVMDLSGEKLHQLEEVLCHFTWAPDGMAIAVADYTPDMDAGDGLKYTVLAVWWLADHHLQMFSDAKDENHSFPVWSIDGRSILFHRSGSNPQEEEGLYVADVASGEMKYLEGTTFHAWQQISRSSRANLVAYQAGNEIMIIDFSGNIRFAEVGNSPLWLPDGKTLFYQTEEGSFQVVEIDVKDALETGVGGQFSSYSSYFFKYFLVFQEDIK